MSTAENSASLKAEKLPQEGAFIVIEGSDACGKTTQTELLRKRLEQEGWPIAHFDFPNYDQPSSYFLQRYLKGEYGPSDLINPQTAALFFALDRYDVKADMQAAQAAGQLILSNRFVASSAAHQGGKIENADERTEFIRWLNDLEFGILGIPKPDLYLVLDIPWAVSRRLLLERGGKLDTHETNSLHQERSRQVYQSLCQIYPQIYKLVDCSTPDKKSILAPQIIHQKIWQLLCQQLPAFENAK